MERWLVISSILLGVILAGATVLLFFPAQKEQGPITCVSDAQCGGVMVSERFCRDGHVYGNGQSNKCLHAGTSGSLCETSYGTVLVEECEDGCTDGTCL